MMKLSLAVLFFMFFLSGVFSESWIDKDIKKFAPASVGVYTEAYEDPRQYISDNNGKSYTEEMEYIYARGIDHKEIYRFKRQLCNYDSVTPPLTLPGYPLGGKKSIIGENQKIDVLLSEKLSSNLAGLAWQPEVIEDFDGGTVKDLLKSAKAKSLDTVLLVRYYPIRFYIPFSSYRQGEIRIDYYTVKLTVSARIGSLHLGVGLLPALELYDTRTGIRLWYSAYYTSHIKKDKYQSQDEYGLAAEEFFIDGAISTIEGDKLIRKKQYYSNTPIEEAAVQRMINLALLSPEVPFPASLGAARRNSSYTRNRAIKEAVKFSLWAEKTPLTFDTSNFSIGYTLNLPVDLDIYYDDKQQDDIEPAVIYRAEDVLVHRFSVAVLSHETHNIVIEPSVFFDLYPTWTVDITYTDSEYNQETEETKEVSRTSSVDFSTYTLGAALNLKYLLRLSEQISFFVGGSGLVEGWMYSQKSTDEKFDMQTDLYLPDDFDDSGVLLPRYTYGLNASLSAGIRLFSASIPLDIYGMYTLRGPSKKPVLSVGAMWHWSSYRTPYARACNRFD